MKRKTVKFLCSFIPVRSWRKKARRKLVLRYALTDEEKQEMERKKKLYDYVVGLAGEGSVCIDCGANIGQETIPWAERGAEVHAFEPHPGCFAVLKERAAPYEKVHLYEKGVWHKNSRMKLYLREGTDTEDISVSSSLVGSKPNVSEESYVEVEIIDLIEFIRQLRKRVDVLKIDIEGAEVELLLELIEGGLYRDIEHIIVETHEQIPEVAAGMKRVRALIEEKGIENINLEWR